MGVLVATSKMITNMPNESVKVKIPPKKHITVDFTICFPNIQLEAMFHHHSFDKALLRALLQHRFREKLFIADAFLELKGVLTEELLLSGTTNGLHAGWCGICIMDCLWMIFNPFHVVSNK